jgi:beta-lactamase superfamily II metal-dependent hydrolase
VVGIITKMIPVARFSFEPVGQGLFCTGRIGSFNMVYDCGELRGITKISNVINEYKKTLVNSKIDMLILSHLHWDHINGLVELMKNTRVRYVFLPYLLPIQRLLLATNATNNADQSYYNFLIDPVNYLIELGAEKVVLIVGKGDEGDQARFEPYDGDTSNQEFNISGDDFNDESILLPEDDDLAKTISEYDSQLLKIKPKLSFKNDSRFISLKDRWVFRFFSPPTKVNLKNFENCVRKILPKTGKIDSHTLSIILSNRSNLDKLIGCYKSTFKNLNDTSLIVFHGPAKKLSSALCYSSLYYTITMESKFYQCSYSFKHRGRIGWLLTGDVDFNKVKKPFLKHFSSYLSSMAYLLIPHHGSKGNWNSEIMNSVTKPSHWIVSFGLGNYYRHPNYDVISEIVKNGNKVSICNEFMRIEQQVFT